MAKKRLKVVNPGRLILTSSLFLAFVGLIVFGVIVLGKVIKSKDPDPQISYDESESQSDSWTDKARNNAKLGGLDEQMKNIMQAFMEQHKRGQDNEDKEYKYTLVILPGHGGEDPGNTAGQNPEKDINLAVSLYIKHYIEEVTDDIKVILSRTTDTFVSYNDQRALADAADPDFLLAIHCNSYNGEAYGTEVEWMTSTDKTIKSRSSAAAKVLSSVTASALKTYNRGAKLVETGDGTVLMKGFDAPAVIIELGFTSDEKEDAKLNSLEYQMALGDAIGAQMIKILNGYEPRNAKEQ